MNRPTECLDKVLLLNRNIAKSCTEIKQTNYNCGRTEKPILNGETEEQLGKGRTPGNRVGIKIHT